MPVISHSPGPRKNLGGSALGKLLKSQLNFPCKCPIRQIRMAARNSILSESNSESRGALIVLEGLDRSGKTSQSSNLLKYLEGLGHSAELWRFPDRSTDVGQMISSYLTNKSQLDDHTVHILFSANRWEKRKLQREQDMEVRDMSSLSFRGKLPDAMRSFVMLPGR
ncbi:hypothetical protein I3842_07G237100 [Carya illinoinensis]|uniref:Thymidylate kinase-like domain-containing protein n=1 Tax=Carya illinoinensis TaxID=32201 RepID=A0A922ESD3_CARIL|nr:hypothetical protein I3842_07G237100 [Carya illinoinensis]